MVNVEFSNAIAEVMDILDHTNKKDVNKISPKFMDYLRKNCSTTYKPNLDHTKRIKDMQLREYTIGILSVIYSKFWCNDEQAKEFNKELDINEKEYQIELRKKYNPDNIFKRK